MENNNEILNIVINALKTRKVSDVVKIDISEKSSIADYFIICSGKSTTQVKALAEFLEEAVEKEGACALRKEGLEEGRWAILDFGDVIVHIFNDETRLFYHLEKLWGDGEKIEVDD